MAEYIVQGESLISVADAIREKGGTNGELVFPAGFAEAIKAITTGIIPAGQFKITENGTFDVTNYAEANVALPEAEQATPSISIDSKGLITAEVEQEGGLVAAGTKSATKQLTTQAAKTVTPGTSDKTAVSSGKYTTGAVKVKGDANLKAENIAEGVSIFGVLGTLAPGGGLPSGISAFASGTITFASDTNVKGYQITHGLGVKPNIALVFVLGDIDATDFDTYTPTICVVENPFTIEGKDHWHDAISEVSAEWGLVYNTQTYIKCTDTVIDMNTNDAYGKFKGGRTYRWIVASVDDL